METFIIKALQLMLSLSILVVFHEFGHYIFARMFGIRVERFYLFFDYKFALLSLKRESKSLVVKICNKFRFEVPMWASKPSDTEFGVGWIPFGGYVSISGMIDESMNVEQMKAPVKDYEFRSRPAWQRLLVMIAGVVFNFILAIIIYSGIAYTWGTSYLPYRNATEGLDYCEQAHEIGFVNGDIPLTADGEELVFYSSESLQRMIESDVVTVQRGNDTIAIEIPDNFMLRLMSNQHPFATYRVPVVVAYTEENMGAHSAGLLKGDHIVSIDSIPTPSFTEMSPLLNARVSSYVEVGYMRGDSLMTASVLTDSLGRIGIGLAPLTEIYPVVTEHYSFWESIPQGIEMGVTKLVNYISSFKYVFTKEGVQSLGGFGAIGSLFAPTWDWYSFWNMTAFLSVILAFMNILPIPALDGGHVLFLLIEVITRRKPSDKFMEIAQTIGMLILFALLIFANGNDIVRFFFK